MNTEFSPEAQELGEVVTDALRDAGGVDLLRHAAADPTSRSVSEGLLTEIGVWDLEPAADQLQFELAAAVCRAAGGVGLPYPVAERLGRTEDAEATTLVPIGGPALVMHADLPLRWSALDLRGDRHELGAATPLPPAPLAPFGSQVESALADGRDTRAASVLMTLHAWWLLGLLETTHHETTRYVGEREQFGRRLAEFQTVQFALADLELAVRGLEELAKYTLWSVARPEHDGRADALGLRMAAQSSAEQVLRSAHQLHGAMGFTDEVDLSWLSKASQAVRRLPEPVHRTAAILVEVSGPQGVGMLGASTTAAR